MGVLTLTRPRIRGLGLIATPICEDLEGGYSYFMEPGNRFQNGMFSTIKLVLGFGKVYCCKLQRLILYSGSHLQRSRNRQEELWTT